MKNIFGEDKQKITKNKPKYIQSKEKTPQITEKLLEKLYNKIESLEKEIITLKSKQEQPDKTALETPRLTEEQINSEQLKQENSLEADDSIQLSHGETEADLTEEYIYLPQPQTPQQNAISKLKQEAFKHITTNRKEIIKQKIEQYLRQQETSAKEVKAHIVDQEQYCSKATFYRYLEELRKESRIDSIKINGKEYLCSIAQKNEPSL